MRTQIKKVLPVLLGLAPSLCLAEIAHTVTASLCISSAKAHSVCVSRHDNVLADIEELRFKCEIKRDGTLRDSEIETFADIGSSSRFTSTLNAPLFGSTSVWYCGYNRSVYYGHSLLFGTQPISPQPGTASQCVNYRGGSGGGTDPF